MFNADLQSWGKEGKSKKCYLSSPKGRPFRNTRICEGNNILPKLDQALKLESEVKDALLTCFQNMVLLPPFCFFWEELELSANIYQAVSLLHSNFSS